MSNEEIKAFLCNEENAHKCGSCPYNEGHSDWQGAYPCGQWNCWVSVTCKDADE